MPYLPLLIGVVVTQGLLVAGWAMHRFLGVGGPAVQVQPFLSGRPAQEQANGRFHARWYALAMVFLAFDVEMLFMYPWALVVGSVGPKAVIEMFGFLLVLMSGVVYAWREGVFRWA